jgi:hypothetical protein
LAVFLDAIATWRWSVLDVRLSGFQKSHPAGPAVHDKSTVFYNVRYRLNPFHHQKYSCFLHHPESMVRGFSRVKHAPETLVDVDG